MKLTPTQLHILQHSLGLDQYGRGREYRNHFVTGPGSHDFADCEALVDGLCMTVRRNLPLAGGSGNNCYTVTDWGRMKMHEQSPSPPKLSKAKKRYHEWMASGECYPDWNFSDWLRYKQKRKVEHGEAY
jgi:hypothetical protein